jgi:hypothetical protein
LDALSAARCATAVVFVFVSIICLSNWSAARAVVLMRMLLVVVVNSIALLISLSSVFVTGRFVLFRMRMRVIRMFVGFVVVIVLRVRLVCVLVVAVAAIFLLLLLGHPRGGGALLLLLLLMMLRRRPAVRVLVVEFDAGFVADGQRQSRVAVRPRSRQSL